MNTNISLSKYLIFRWGQKDSAVYDYLHMFLCAILFSTIKIRGEDRDAVCVSGLGSWAGSNVKSAKREGGDT